MILGFGAWPVTENPAVNWLPRWYGLQQDVYVQPRRSTRRQDLRQLVCLYGHAGLWQRDNSERGKRFGTRRTKITQRM